MPESYSCCRYRHSNSTLQQHPLPLRKLWCPRECFMLSCPTHKAYHKGLSFECSQTDGGRQCGPCPVRRVQRDSRECRPCRSRTAAAGTDMADSTLQQHTGRYLRGFHEPDRRWLIGKRSRGYLLDFATLNAQSTRHGARLGPTIAPWCTGGPPACPPAKSARKDPRSEEKTFLFREKKE